MIMIQNKKTQGCGQYDAVLLSYMEVLMNEKVSLPELRGRMPVLGRKMYIWPKQIKISVFVKLMPFMQWLILRCFKQPAWYGLAFPDLCNSFYHHIDFQFSE